MLSMSVAASALRRSHSRTAAHPQRLHPGRSTAIVVCQCVEGRVDAAREGANLLLEARRHARSQVVAAADAVLSQAAYEAKLGDCELRFTGRLQIAKFRQDRETLDLPFGGLAIESATLDGRPAQVGRKPDGTLFLMLEKEGRYELKLEMSAPLAGKAGDLATTLKLPPVPAAEMLLRLGRGEQLQIGDTVLQCDGGDGDQQRFRAAIGGRQLLPLVISEGGTSGNRTPLVLVNSRSTLRLEPAGVCWDVFLDLDVHASQPTPFAFSCRLRCRSRRSSRRSLPAGRFTRPPAERLTSC